MQPFLQFQQPIQTLFTDIDDTLTNDGRLGAKAYEMLWKLAQANIDIIPVTGRPAGWCEMIARLWPVAAVIGENGAFYFKYENKKMKRHFFIDEKTRKENKEKLKKIGEEILFKVPEAALASDQFTRLFDLAIDFSEDVEPLAKSKIQEIVNIFSNHGAIAKVSSIHVNGWFGNYDKKTMCEVYYENEYALPLDQNQKSCAFIGDSPNDEPLFRFFENSFAVENIKDFSDVLTHKPKYLVNGFGGEGFTALGKHLLSLF